MPVTHIKTLTLLAVALAWVLACSGDAASRIAMPTVPRSATFQRASSGSWDGAMAQLAAELADVPRDRGALRVAVFDFTDAAGNDCGLGSTIAEELTTRLFQEHRFEVVERRRLRQVLAEQRLGASDLVDPETVARVGHLLGVHAVVDGSVIEGPAQTRFHTRAIAVDTGTIISAGSADADASETAAHGRCPPGAQTVHATSGLTAADKQPPAGAKEEEARPSHEVYLRTRLNKTTIGDAPRGWQGVDNFMVVDLGRGRRAVRCFRPGPARLQIPVPKLPHDYVVEVVFVIGSEDIWHPPELSLGGTSWGFGRHDVHIGETSVAFGLPRSGVPTVVRLERRGNVYRMSVDGPELVLERHSDSQVASSLVVDLFSGGDAPCNHHLFELRSVTIHAPGAEPREEAALEVPASAPPQVASPVSSQQASMDVGTAPPPAPAADVSGTVLRVGIEIFPGPNPEGLSHMGLSCTLQTDYALGSHDGGALGFGGNFSWQAPDAQSPKVKAGDGEPRYLGSLYAVLGLRPTLGAEVGIFDLLEGWLSTSDALKGAPMAGIELGMRPHDDQLVGASVRAMVAMYERPLSTVEIMVHYGI